MALRPTHPDHRPLAMDGRSAVFSGSMAHSEQLADCLVARCYVT
jgi:hypothetical protein